MTSSHIHKPALHNRSQVNKENNLSSSNLPNEIRYNAPMKYRKMNEPNMKPIPIQPAKENPSCDSSLAQTIPYKFIRKEGLSKRINHNNVKNISLIDRNPGNNNLKDLKLSKKDSKESYSFLEKENEKLLFENAEKLTIEEHIGSIKRENKKPLIIETIKSGHKERDAPKKEFKSELVVAMDPENERLTPEDGSDSLKKDKKNDAPTIDFKAQCNKTIEEYTSEIMEALKSKDKDCTPIYCLQKHKITPTLRAKMVDWMVEVLTSYKCSDNTFFTAANIMDLYLEKTKTEHEISDLHLVGVTSMFISAKYEEIYPLRLSVIYEKISHKKLTPQQVKDKEMVMLATLEYKLTNPTVYEFITNILFQLNLTTILTPKLNNYLRKVCVYLAKTAVHDYELISQQDYSELAASIMYVAFKIIGQLDKSFPISHLSQKVAEIMNVEEEIIMDCSARILSLAKNFDRLYPNLENLKKFHSFNLDDECTDNKKQ